MSDLISRQAAIDGINNICPVDTEYDCTLLDRVDVRCVLSDLPSAQPDNQINLCDSCDYSYPDCPSKNDDVIFGNDIGNDNICACNKYKPSAQQDRKKGHWIDTGSGQECSICHEIQYGYDNYRHFCPNCGADMRGGYNERPDTT